MSEDGMGGAMGEGRDAVTDGPATGEAGPAARAERPGADTGGRRFTISRARIGWVAALVTVVALVFGVFAAVAEIGLHRDADTPVATLSTPTPTAAPTATDAGPPRTLYRADWSHGAGDWTLPPGAKIVNGQLVTDGSGAVDIAIPYVVDVARYSIEMDVQVQLTRAGPDTDFNSDLYGVVAHDGSGAEMYSLEIVCESGRTYCNGQVLLYVDHYAPDGRAAAFGDHDFTSGGGARSYLLKLDGQTAQICTPSTVCLFSVTGSAPLSPAHLVLTLHNIQLIVTGFAITTP